MALTYKTAHIRSPVAFLARIPTAYQVEHMDNERQLCDMGTEMEELQSQLDRLRNEFMVKVVFWWEVCFSCFGNEACKFHASGSLRSTLTFNVAV